MDASSPEGYLWRPVLWRACLVGAVLGVVTFGGGALILYDSAGLLTGATGLIGTALLALGIGLWAGAPAAEAAAPLLRTRWLGAGLATGLAGTFASFWTLYGEIAAGPALRVLALLVLVAVPTYALGLILPVLLAWGDTLEDDAGAAVGWGALGAVVMGLLAGLVVGGVAAGLFLIPRFTPGPLILAVSMVLLVPVVIPEPEGPAADESLLFETGTPFGTIRVAEVVYPGERQPERRLYLNGEEESGELVRSGAPTLAYIAAAEHWLVNITPPGGSYLFLGGGAYTLPRRVAERDPGARVTVVELDPEVTRVAYRFFGVRREHGIVTVHGDARAYLEEAGQGERFDRMYLDVYDGREALPYPLVTREAFDLARHRLQPTGWLAMNLIGVPAGLESRRFWSVVRTLADVFPTVGLYLHHGPDFPERQNALLVASPEPGREPPAGAGLFELWPRDRWPDVQGAIVYRDLLAPPERETVRERPARSS